LSTVAIIDSADLKF